MRTSARNQYQGVVCRLTKGQVNAEVVLQLRNGAEVVAQVTNESVDALGLAEGKPAFALIKANWIILASGADEPRVSARNCLRGTVEKVIPGAVNAEVTLQLAGGGTLTSIITKESVERLGFRVGDVAWALFKAGSVILAVDG